MRLLGLVSAALLLPTLAMAKQWESRAACEVTQPAVHPQSIAPLSEPDLIAAGQDIVNSTGRLWKITGPNGAVSHLWGTYHTTDRLVLDLPERTTELIGQAQAVVVEADFIYATREEMKAGDQFAGWMRTDSSEFAFSPATTGLSEEMISWIGARLDSMGLGYDAPNFFTFGAVASMLLGDPCDDFAIGTLPIQDRFIQTLGYISGAETVELEAESDLVDHLNKAPETALAIIKVYASYLNPSLTQADRATGATLYQRGLIGAMIKLDVQNVAVSLGPDGDDALRLADGYLVEQRNLNWLPVLETQLEQGQSFVAVGAFHLPGSTGLIELMRARGYVVERIPLPGEAS